MDIMVAQNNKICENPDSSLNNNNNNTSNNKNNNNYTSCKDIPTGELALLAKLEEANR